LKKVVIFVALMWQLTLSLSSLIISLCILSIRFFKIRFLKNKKLTSSHIFWLLTLENCFFFLPFSNGFIIVSLHKLNINQH
jgi:hypothetical protein